MKSSAAGDGRDLAAGNSGGSRAATTESAALDTESGSGAVGFLGASYEETDYNWLALADVRYSIPSGNDFERLTHFSLMPATFEDEQEFGAIYVGGAGVEYQSGSLADLATRRPWMLEAGLVYRRYFNHARTGFSPYVTASAGYQLFGWTYRNPIVVGGETVTSDALHGAQGYLGLGITTRRASAFGAFAEIGVGGTAFANHTTEGFDDDVFDRFGFVSFKAGLSVKF